MTRTTERLVQSRLPVRRAARDGARIVTAAGAVPARWLRPDTTRAPRLSDIAPPSGWTRPQAAG